MAIKKVLITRHAETDESLLKTIRTPEESNSDPINLNGRLQAKKLGEFLYSNYPISQIHSSTAIRSIETAEVIQKYTKSTITITKCLEEVKLADMADMLQEERRRVWNMTLTKWQDDIGFKNFGGESLQEVGVRLKDYILRILASPNEETVLIVSHQGLIAFGLAYMFHEVEQWKDFQLVNCGLTIIEEDLSVKIIEKNLKDYLGDVNSRVWS